MQRWAIVGTAAGALMLFSGTAAQAAPAQSKNTQNVSQKAASADREGRSTQGTNFCLLSICSVGGNENGNEQGGILGLQGINFCLLSSCEVRP
ncbi:hypothetical protein MTQ01_17440 [Streptomyces sp. XM4193]|uniref:hypothetical protein n=1 Tax=Streptomyces sp. XM4193 TaxID=2929782 RepID=UPI001FFABA85|nr:hypothetical protein [Streptomyces sp. XM4193]MCK1797779.1 hypothetical protein [Streptomyces sp. XM4193]